MQDLSASYTQEISLRISKNVKKNCVTTNPTIVLVPVAHQSWITTTTKIVSYFELIPFDPQTKKVCRLKTGQILLEWSEALLHGQKRSEHSEVDNCKFFPSSVSLHPVRERAFIARKTSPGRKVGVVQSLDWAWRRKVVLNMQQEQQKNQVQYLAKLAYAIFNHYILVQLCNTILHIVQSASKV